MTEVAIRVENLGKMYHIGRAQQRHDTLCDAIVGTSRGLTFKRSNVQRVNDDYMWALKNISLKVKRGEVVGAPALGAGVIGRNGAGKTTLLKILCRITEPTEGRAETSS